MNYTNINLNIINRKLLDVPSASGIIKHKENYFVIGDDSPFLFKLNSDYDVIGKFHIHSNQYLVNDHIPKIHKPDFEAIHKINDREALIFGSGSKSPERDVCVLVNLDNPDQFQSFNIASFYARLKGFESMSTSQLDIEAITCVKDRLYLFNRGNNLVFECSLAAFLDYCKVGTTIPIITLHNFELPELSGLSAGFSAATYFLNKNFILFTAAVEDAPNAYNDGPILGSFLGLIPFENNVINTSTITEIIPQADFSLKVEGLCIAEEISENKFQLVMVTDNDGKPSEILEAEVILS